MNGSKEEKMPSKKAKAKVIRPLGYMERFAAALHALGFYRSTMVTCRFAIPPSLVPEPGSNDLPATLKQKVESAFALVVLEHALLRVGLFKEHARKPAFVELESIDFNNHIEWRVLSPSVDYEAEVVRLIKERIDIKVESPETKPAWRILVLHSEDTNFIDFMFEWGHAHLDGISVKLLFESLLEKLNNGDEAGPSIFKNRVLTIPLEKRRDLLPPLHGLCKFPLTMGWSVTALWKQLTTLSLVGKSDLLATWAPIRTKPYKTQYRHISIDNEILQKIISACREHKTTLTGLLQTLTTLSLATRLSPEEARGFLTTTVVNLRPLMSSRFLQSHNIDPNKIMGNYVTMVDHEFDTDLIADVRARVAENPDTGGRNYMAPLEEFVWPTAKRIRGDLQHRLDNGLKNDQMGLVKFIPDFRLLLKDWVRKPRAQAIALTNMGVLDGNPSSNDAVETEGGRSDRWIIDRAVFSISCEVQHAAFCMSSITVKGKELFLACYWQDCAIDVALGDGVVADLQSWLQYFGR